MYIDSVPIEEQGRARHNAVALKQMLENDNGVGIKAKGTKLRQTEWEQRIIDTKATAKTLMSMWCHA